VESQGVGIVPDDEQEDADHMYPCRRMRMFADGVCGIMVLIVFWGCGTPTAKVEVVPSDKPITINLNVKIDHEVRVKVERELDAVFSKESKLF